MVQFKHKLTSSRKNTELIFKVLWITILIKVIIIHNS